MPRGGVVVQEPLNQSGKVGFELRTDAKARLFLLPKELSTCCFLSNEPGVRASGFMAEIAPHPHKDDGKEGSEAQATLTVGPLPGAFLAPSLQN